MQREFSRRDFLKGMAVVTASGLLAACGGSGNGSASKLAFIALEDCFEQSETSDGYVLIQEFQVKNQSIGEVTLDGLLDETLLNEAENYSELGAAIRKYAKSTNSIATRTSAGAVPCVVVLDSASNKTLKPGESGYIYLFAVAPSNETTLDILYQGAHQCYLSYGKGRLDGEVSDSIGGSGAGTVSSSTASSSAASAEPASSTAASEVGVIESPRYSVGREVSASR